MMYEGLPYRGPTISLKKDDPESRQPFLTYTAHARVFDLSDDLQLKDYEQVWTSIVVGNCAMGIEEVNFNAVTGVYLVFMRWTEQFYTAPPKQEI